MTDAPLLHQIRSAVAAAAGAVVGEAPAAVPLAAPASAGMGDLASPVAMALAKAARRPPREIAEAMAAHLTADSGSAAWLAGVEVAGPGFLNMTLTPSWFAAAAAELAAAGGSHGAGLAATPQSILLEFVSANPTGPLHVGHARQAAYGDALGRILSFAGHRVTREYYTNDHGRQMRLFGESVAARYAGLFGRDRPVPEGGYNGDYVVAIAEAVRDEVGDALMSGAAEPTGAAIDEFTERGERLMLVAIADVLARFRVSFDSWFSERTLHEGGHVSTGIATLRASRDAYEAEGAVWFRASAYGDDKDRVLVRGGGDSTYLAADVAYHLQKAGRGHDLLIDVLGADHHGYIARLRAVLEAGGHDPDSLEVMIVQLVSLLERGEAKKMSKRAGTVVTIGDLLDDIGVDAARFFLVQRSHETPLDLDLGLAREQSRENPVYYVQYAHARICGILTRYGRPPDRGSVGGLDEVVREERALLMKLADWPVTVSEAEERRAPHRVAAYLIDLAGDFQRFYERCPVVGTGMAVAAFRLDLCHATAATIRAGLDLLGVEAPERM